VGLYTELFYAIIPTLFLCFLLICYPYILLHFYYVFYSCLLVKSESRQKLYLILKPEPLDIMSCTVASDSVSG